mgnify:CR=1 FL=1
MNAFYDVAPVTTADYRRLAARRLPRFLFDYIDGGANEERTMAANVADFAAIRIRQRVMRDVSGILKEVYKGSAVALAPGGGTYAMEAVARQFGQGHALIVRNGWFSYRWTQIFDAGGFAKQTTVVMARAAGNSPTSSFAPPPIEEVVAKIRETRPGAVFAPHVDDGAGLGRKMVGPPALGNDFIDEPAA